MRKLIRITTAISLLIAGATMLSACEDGEHVAPNDVPAQVFEPETGQPNSSEGGAANVILNTEGFPGTISLSSANAEVIDGGFQIPVYLQNVASSEAVDTVTLKMALPEGVALKQVLASSGLTAQLDGLSGNAPVVYLHPFSLSADSYSPVVASESPIMTLLFTGNPNGKMAIEGSFFQTSGSLLRTNRAILSL